MGDSWHGGIRGRSPIPDEGEEAKDRPRNESLERVAALYEVVAYA